MARSLRGLVASLLPVAVVVAAILVPLNAGGQEQSTFSAGKSGGNPGNPGKSGTA